MKLALWPYVLVGVFFSILSSLRIGFLPEAQFSLLLLWFALYRGFTVHVAAVLICILCTHHYAIPDAAFRMASSFYPSIYTKSYGPVKLLDLMVVFLFLAATPYMKFLCRAILSKRFPSILLVMLVLGAILTPISQQSGQNFLFITRSVMLLFAVFLLFYRFSSLSIQKLSLLAIVSWTAKMFFSVVFPADYPLYRDVFGIQWNIFFAGDEYLSLGVYACTILCLAQVGRFEYARALKPRLWLLFSLLGMALLLALVAQRKGAIAYFALLFIVMIVDYYKRRNIYVNILIYLSPWGAVIFLLLVLPLLPDIVKILFFEYSNLLDSAIESLKKLASERPQNFIFGLGPVGMYEIVGLSSVNDHATSFGEEVGETFRYTIWNIPYGRLLLNVGLIGFVVYNYFLLKMVRSSPSYFYLYASIVPVFYFSNLTPPAALAYGVGLLALWRSVSFRKSGHRRQLEQVRIQRDSAVAI